jgi:hypothetical protein
MDLNNPIVNKVNDMKLNEGPRHFQFYCPSCLWFSDLDVGMKNKCPNSGCNHTLHIIGGSKAELEKFKDLVTQ